jgi:hypothetical protein
MAAPPRNFPAGCGNCRDPGQARAGVHHKAFDPPAQRPALPGVAPLLATVPSHLQMPDPLSRLALPGVGLGSVLAIAGGAPTLRIGKYHASSARVLPTGLHSAAWHTSETRSARHSGNW